MKLQLRRAARHPLKFLKSLGPFSLSHHPQCEYFANHSLRIRNHRFCIGCFVGYPVFVASVAILLMMSLFLGIDLEANEAILIGIAFESITIFVKVAHVGNSVSAKVLVKSSQGVGLGFLLLPFLTLQAPIIFKLFVLFTVWSFINVILGSMRIYETGKICDACQYKGRWSRCPGFKKTVKQLCDAGFIA